MRDPIERPTLSPVHYVFWILTLVLVDAGLLYLWVAVSVEENCGNGVSRLTCAEVLQDAVPVLPYTFAAGVAVTLFVVLMGAGSTLRGRGRRDDAPGDRRREPAPI